MTLNRQITWDGDSLHAEMVSGVLYLMQGDQRIRLLTQGALEAVQILHEYLREVGEGE